MFYIQTRSISAICLTLVFLTALATSSANGVDEARQHVAALAKKALDEHQQFVLLHMPSGSDEKAGTKQLAGILGDITKPAGVVLVIGSEDTSTMAAMVKKAFASVRRGRLDGCLVVFVGARSDQQSVGEAVTKAGSQFRFVEFQP